MSISVGIVMGSDSDFETMKPARDVLSELGIGVEVRVLSAHRTPDAVVEYARSAQGRGLKVLIGGAGGAAALPGLIAALTPLPVLGVPVESKALKGMDSLLSIVQMPGGVPTATFAIGSAGAKNAGIFAARIMALSDQALAERLEAFTAKQAEKCLAADERVQKL